MGEYLVGCYAPPGEDSIFRVRVNEANLRMERIAAFRCAENPSYLLLHPSRNVLYAVEELVPNGRIAVLQVKGDRLDKILELPSGGSAPCHLALDEDGRFLFVSNYMSGSLAVFALDRNGLPLGMTDLKQHRGAGFHPQRQEGPHVHSSYWWQGELLVCDLGLDTVFCYRLDSATGRLQETDRALSLPPGTGPRHMCRSSRFSNILYIDGELSGDIFAWDVERNRILQQISAVPEEICGCFTMSAIKARANSLCVANRGYDSYAMFEIQEDGLLRLLRIGKHAYRAPRDFLNLPEGILSADQDSRQLSALRWNEQGSLEVVDVLPLASAMPACLLPFQWRQ